LKQVLEKLCFMAFLARSCSASYGSGRIVTIIGSRLSGAGFEIDPGREYVASSMATQIPQYIIKEYVGDVHLVFLF
jgi:hypothetical protein